MSDPPIDPRDVLISLVTAALKAAEADAAAPKSRLIFRPEWRPIPRYRSSTSLPPDAPGANQSDPYWLNLVPDQLSRYGLRLQQDRHLSPGLSARRTPPSTYAPPLASASVHPPSAASVPESLLPPGRPPPPERQPQKDAVAELLKKNQDVLDEVMDHPFPRALGNGTASLDGFRYYMIQDKMYLETCARLKMTAVAATPNFKDLETFEFRHNSSIEYIAKLKEICITMLGISESTLESTPRSVQLDASERFYKDSLRNEDALLGYYVVLLPCVLTYWRIAERLMNDPSTAKNVVYHPAWTVVNYDPSSVDKYTKFINENIAAKGGIDRWNYIFRIACQLETKLFNTGLQAPIPFQIIPDGTYSIHVFSGEGLVLGIQNVKSFLRPPLDRVLGGYFPRDDGSCVVGMKKTGADNERWHVVATKAGYTFKNMGTGLYLGMTPEGDREESRILQAVRDPHYWWINPVSSQPAQGPPVYQIYDSVNLRYTLHAASEILDSIGSINFCYTPVIAHENSQLSCQMWSFNDKLEQSEHTQIYSDDHKWVEYRNAELGKQLQKAHTMNAGFSAELAAEMKKLMEKHSNDMENLKEEMAKAISAKEEALQKELEAERTKMQKQMIKLEEQKKALADGLTAAREGADRKLHEQAADFDRRVKETEESAQEEQKKLIAELDKILSEKAAADTKLKDSEKMARAQTRQKLQHIRSLLDAAQKEKEGAYRKHLDLLRSVRAQICHWESFSGTFHSASFNPAPIEYGGVHRENGHSFVIRVKERLKDPGKESITVWIQDVQEGDSLQTTHSVYASQEHQVLVGDPSRLLWVSLHGRFKVKSIGYNPVPGWNEEVGGVSDTLFIARFSHSGNVYLAGVEEGDDDVSCKSSGYPQIRAQDYEVLCYKDL